MDAIEYFTLFGAIADARTPERLDALDARVAATALHRFARRAPERPPREPAARRKDR